MTPAEEKLMVLISWVTVTGTEGFPELGGEVELEIPEPTEKANVHVDDQLNEDMPITEVNNLHLITALSA